MKTHIVKKGDTLSSLAALYYSNPSLYLRIYEANGYLQGREYGDLANDSILYIDEVVGIPTINALQSGEIISEVGDTQIYINDEVFKGWSGLAIDLNLDTIADTVSIALAYNAQQPYEEIFRRFKYQDVQIIFKGGVVLTGVIPLIEITSGEKSTVVTAKGYSKTGVLNEINLPPNMYPRKFDSMSFIDIATKLCTPFGIKVEVSDSAIDQAKIAFDEAKIGTTEKIGAFLTNLARDRSLILSPTGFGNLYVDSIVSGKNESLSIVKPDNPERKNSAVFDGTKLFDNLYLLDSGDEFNPPTKSVFRFPINATRPKVLTQDKNSKQNNSKKIENAAKKALAEAQKINASIPDWLDDDNELLIPGSIVSIKDPSLQIPETERHIIRSVKLTTSPRGGRQAAYTVVLEAAMVAV